MGERNSGGQPRRLSLLPVPSDERGRRPLRQAPSWWEQASAWLRFHTIQARWDIERALARLLKRCWSTGGRL
jgi:hypothetical protein